MEGKKLNDKDVNKVNEKMYKHPYNVTVKH